MSLPELLHELATVGITLAPVGDSIGATPRSALTDLLRAGLKAHKPALRFMLTKPGARLVADGVYAPDAHGVDRDVWGRRLVPLERLSPQLLPLSGREETVP